MLRLIGDAADRYQRQLQPKRVRHVSGHAGKAVKEGKGAECRAGKFAAYGKAHRQQRGHQQLKQRSSPESESFSQPAKKQMPAFMNGKMNVIEQRQLAPVQREIQKQQSVKDVQQISWTRETGCQSISGMRICINPHVSFFAGCIGPQRLSLCRPFLCSGIQIHIPNACRHGRKNQPSAKSLCHRFQSQPCKFPPPDCGRYMRRSRRSWFPEKASFSRTTAPASGTVCSVVLS